MNSIALVTGASGGIGSALARQLQAQGCRVAAVGRDAGRLADVQATVRIAADTTTPDAPRWPLPPAGKLWVLRRRCWRTAWAAH